jgi:hypothetical protein
LRITQYIGDTHNARTLIPMNTRTQTIPLGASSKTAGKSSPKLVGESYLLRGHSNNNYQVRENIGAQTVTCLEQKS